MGTAAKKPRAMRSRRSGVKKMELVKANLEVLNKLKNGKVKRYIKRNDRW